jgi:NADH-quinone oxidoreductase subunit G
MNDNYIYIDGRPVALADDRNLLELIRRSGIDLPTFCYHSDLSAYGACRLCIVEIDGMGTQASCSIQPTPGMRVRTNSSALRESRRLTIELLLANHDRECPSCERSNHCSLQNLARQLGVDTVRFKQRQPEDMLPVDSSPALVRDPNKCVLCGDCVRVCDETQGIRVLDFVGRGAAARVAPAFEQGLAVSECVGCGQCAAVCPTGAIVPKQEREDVWALLHDPDTVVIAQVAPAVRVGLGEYFGMEPGSVVTGQMVSALKMLGFDRVYDTSFAADMTIFEEVGELLGRLDGEGPLPLMTSCCPAWVRFVETQAPDLLPHLSSCKSPQQMFGSVIKQVLPEQEELDGKRLAVVSIMPCTAKKAEARLPQHRRNGVPDVDQVLTTQELGRMIHSLGIRFTQLDPTPFDLPLGLASGAGVIFGASGGVTEAALRYAAETVDAPGLHLEFQQVRGLKGCKEASIQLGEIPLRVAVVQGLAEARQLLERVRQGESYHFIEVMSCPGGCLAGAGQPINKDRDIRARRSAGIYRADGEMPLRKSQDNHLVRQCYQQHLGTVGGHAAHELLHTRYQDRREVFAQALNWRQTLATDPLRVRLDVASDQADLDTELQRLHTELERHPEGDRVAVELAVQAGSLPGRARIGRGEAQPLAQATRAVLVALDGD